MKTLILHRELDKKAAGEGGPNLEQQFGIVTNEKIVEKFPQLDTMKLAFQIIEKNDEATNAVGVMAYLVGKCVVYVPSIFRNGEVNTGDIMFVAQTQQFLPLSDPWLAWVKNKGLPDAAELLPKDMPKAQGGPGSALTTDYVHGSFGKRASSLPEPDIQDVLDIAHAYLRGVGSLVPDKEHDTPSVMDMALSMGKEASGALCEEMSKDASALNQFLSYYSPEQLDEFSKQAAASFAPVVKEAAVAVLPFTEEAKNLTGDEQEWLKETGWFIKKAADDQDTGRPVVKEVSADKVFSTLSGPGKAEILLSRGRTKTVVVLLTSDEEYSHTPRKIAVDGDVAYELPDRTVELVGSHEPITREMVAGIGTPFTGNLPKGENRQLIDYFLVSPDGSCFSVGQSSSEGMVFSFRTGCPIVIGDNPGQVSPVMIGQRFDRDRVLVVPKDTKYIRLDRSKREDGRIITESLLPTMMNNFTNIRYNKVKVMGIDGKASVSGDKTASVEGATEADCALLLVRDYGLSNKDARMLLKDAADKSSKGVRISTTYLIEKTAAEIDSSANIGFSEYQNTGEQTERKDMPPFVDDPEDLKQSMDKAVQSGIKEVFDVTTLKLLVKKTKFFDDIKESIPLYMRTLDSLCRRLFQFYWHTDKMEEKYGMAKLKLLEGAIKAAIDTLSELTIFFGIRTVDGTGSTGDTATDLIGGKML